jgi:uncharacterized protein YecT (DUF1311 family)
LKHAIQRGTVCGVDEIKLDRVLYHDFTGDGQDEAVVMAFTCLTGTAGWDVHTVFTRDTNGEVVELPLPEFASRNRAEFPLFGNANYILEIEKGEIVARWRDQTDREPAISVWYKWDGKEFVIERKLVTGPFKTSYDCAKATRETELEICYSPSVAPLDAQLGQLYRTRLAQLSPENQAKLKRRQRLWLAERESKCPIPQGNWGECAALYNQRIAELR